MLRNTSKGHSLYTTFQLQKNFVDGILKGLYLNGSYSFGQSRGVTDGTSSVATSAWKYRAALDGNAEEVGYTAGSLMVVCYCPLLIRLTGVNMRQQVLV